jgi:WD40 repeat protein
LADRRPTTAEREAAGQDPAVSGLSGLIERSSLGAEGARLLRSRGTDDPVIDAAAGNALTSVPTELAGKFALIRALPSGGEADMLLVADAADTNLVLKLYRPGVVPSPETWRALQAIDSPHITSLVDWGEAGGRVYEVLEYIPAGTLADLTDTGPSGPVETKLIVEVIRQVTDGLTALHDARVIHRDLKPANILVRSWSPLELALTDFGLSRYLDHSTIFSNAGHTLAYTAPETFAGHVSPGRDWWSLGMIVRELAMGESPFGELSTEVVMLQLASRPIDCTRITDPRLRLLCQGLLTRDPGMRWGASQVRSWLAGEYPPVAESEPAVRPLPGTAGAAWRGLCPFRGLAPYEEHDAEVFCGRDQVTLELVAALSAQLNVAGRLIVTGASGAGKSSLLRAGLLPRIAHGELAAGSQDWPRILMTPGRAPLDELATRLAPVCSTPVPQIRQQLADRPHEAGDWLRAVPGIRAPAPGAAALASPLRLVLIIDQFEDVFTQADEAERSAFIEVLDSLAGHASGGPAAVVVLGLRSDFYAQCLAYPSLRLTLQSATFIVKPMTTADIRLAITQPAAIAGLTFEDGLADVVVSDASTVSPQGDLGPGMLPFLSQAMMETWQRRTGMRLTLSGYKAGGGVTHSIQHSAEQAYESLSPGQRQAARNLLCRMVYIGADGRQGRRPMKLADAGLPATENGDDLAVALETFTRARLVVLSDTAAEIVHDALLHAWPRFREWIADDARQIQAYSELTQHAADWQQGGRDRSYLYNRVRLAAALSSAGDQRDLPTATRSFLDASRREVRRQQNLRKAAVLSMVALLLIGIIVGASVRSLARTVQRQQMIALSREVASESQSINNPVLSALLAEAAWRMSPTSSAASVMAAAYARQNVIALPGQTSPVTSLAFSPDQSTLAAAGQDGIVHLWNIATHQQVGTLTNGSGLGFTEVTFSPGGRILATASGDGTIRIWDLATDREIGKPVTLTPRAPETSTSAPGESVSIVDMAFSPDGKLLATVGQNGSALLWDVATGRPAGTLAAGGAVNQVAFSPDGKLLATVTQNGVVLLWDVATGHRAGTLAAMGGAVKQVAFSPDGATLATVSQNGAVLLYELASGRLASTLPAGSGATQAVFSPRGATLAIVTRNGAVGLWNTATHRQEGAPLTGGGVTQEAFSPDGKFLALANTGSTVQLWKPTNKASPEQLSRSICAKAGRGLTRAEWNRYVPSAPYEKYCPA